MLIEQTVSSREFKDFYERQAQASDGDADPGAFFRFESIRRYLLKQPRPPRRALDVGCRNGEFGHHLRGSFSTLQCHGIELSPTRAERATKVYEAVHCADIRLGLPYSTGFFDVVVCLELLEHVPDPIAVLRELRRVVNEHGKLFISTPNPFFYLELLQNLLHKTDKNGEHILSFTPQNMENAFRFAGLNLVHRLGTYTRLPKSKRLFSANSFFLTRSFLYVAEPQR